MKAVQLSIPSKAKPVASIDTLNAARNSSAPLGKVRPEVSAPTVKACKATPKVSNFDFAGVAG